MSVIYGRPKGLNANQSIYCPGCTHGLEHKLVMEVLEELGVLDRTIGVTSVGCSGLMYRILNTEVVTSLHGRAPAVATGIKAVQPDSIVYIHQGDGDALSIGMGETISAASRGENITVIFANNNIYGMTGGQMASTTMIGDKATTCPAGRDASLDGNPMKAAELVSQVNGSKYVERVALFDVPYILKAKKAIKKAFQNQIDGHGYSFVEILSTCPTNWHLDPLASMEKVKNEMVNVYPLGVFKDE